jgi:hypothetical protein
MRGAFVVHLRKAKQGIPNQMEGSVEEVDTGKQFHFRSEDELIVFLRERFAETGWTPPGSEGTKCSP